MSYSFSTRKGTAATNTIPVSVDTSGYTLSVEMSTEKNFSTVTTKSVTGSGKNVTLALTSTEVDALGRGYFRVKATKNGQTSIIQDGTITYLSPITTAAGNDSTKTALSVGGVFQPTYNIDTTPVTPGDIGAQPADSDLTTIAALSPAQNDFIQRKSGAWINRTPAQVKVDLGIPGDYFGYSQWSVGGAEPFERPNSSDGAGWGTAVFAASHFTAPVANTITKLGMPLTDTGATTGLTFCRLGIYTVNVATDTLTLVARTANDTTFGNNGNATVPQLALSTVGGYPASYTFVPGQRYAFAGLITGTTPPGLFSRPQAGGLTLLKPRINSYAFGQSDLPASIVTAQSWFFTPYIVGLA